MTRASGERRRRRPNLPRAADIAAQIDAELHRLPVENVPSVRAVRRTWTNILRTEAGRFVLSTALILRRRYGYRFVPYELIAYHPGAYRLLGETKLHALGRGLDSWHTVDSFARTLAGPAWRDGLIDDSPILRWAHSRDRWWRRAALVSTVALNLQSQGGQGDVPRTLRVCGLLVDDHDDMVEKALSWALRALVVHDPRAVEAFLISHEVHLGSRIRREVRSKLKTGLKSSRPATRR